MGLRRREVIVANLHQLEEYVDRAAGSIRGTHNYSAADKVGIDFNHRIFGRYVEIQDEEGNQAIQFEPTLAEEQPILMVSNEQFALGAVTVITRSPITTIP